MSRVRLQQLGLVDAHLVQRDRLEVLDEHVALRDETHEQLALIADRGRRACTSACRARSELFIAWRLYGRSSLTGRQRAVHPRQRAEHHVRLGARDVALRRRWEHARRLDPDHLGAEVAEERGEVGARPHRREVEHPDAAQRRHRGIGARRPAAPRRGTPPVARRRLALPETRCGSPQRPPALGEPVRRTGKEERARARRRRCAPRTHAGGDGPPRAARRVR